jgi:hypothetical protein
VELLRWQIVSFPDSGDGTSAFIDFILDRMKTTILGFHGDCEPSISEGYFSASLEKPYSAGFLEFHFFYAIIFCGTLLARLDKRI